MSHLARTKYLECNCIFVNDTLYQNVMFGQGNERLSKSTEAINGLNSIIKVNVGNDQEKAQ